jgi:hypothetical protein
MHCRVTGLDSGTAADFDRGGKALNMSDDHDDE